MTHFSFISPTPFSLFSSLFPQTSVLSPLPCSLLRREWGGPAARWPTTVGGGAAARATSLFLIFLALSLLHLPVYSILNPKPPNTNPKLLDLRKTKGKKRKENYLCEFGLVSVCVRFFDY